MEKLKISTANASLVLRSESPIDVIGIMRAFTQGGALDKATILVNSGKPQDFKKLCLFANTLMQLLEDSETDEARKYILKFAKELAPPKCYEPAGFVDTLSDVGAQDLCDVLHEKGFLPNNVDKEDLAHRALTELEPEGRERVIKNLGVKTMLHIAKVLETVIPAMRDKLSDAVMPDEVVELLNSIMYDNLQGSMVFNYLQDLILPAKLAATLKDIYQAVESLTPAQLKDLYMFYKTGVSTHPPKPQKLSAH